MFDQATVNAVIDTPPARCYELAAGIEDYPEWAADIKDATVDERDDEGRPLVVTFRAAAMGRSTTYTLRYDYGGAPERLAWTQERGDITSRLDGWYTFAAAADEPGRTEVTYHLEVELVVPLPGFVKRRAEGRLLHTAIADLKAYAER